MPDSLAPVETLMVPFDDCANFTRKLVHDVRNGLNAIDLQLASALDGIGEDSGPLREDIYIARRLVADEARRLGRLSAQLRCGVPQFIDYGVAELVEDLRGRIEGAVPDATHHLVWTVARGSQQVSVDFEFLSSALTELVRNAVQCREGKEQIRAQVCVEAGSLVFEFLEPHAAISGDPEVWGVTPFRSTRRNGYGLGLFAARRALAALGGALKISHDVSSGELRLRVTLPLPHP